MKKQFLFLIAFLISAVSIAQNGINYKALIRDGAGNIVANTQVDLEITIKNDVSQLEVYYEQQSVVTTSDGMLILVIGEGTDTNQDFNTIDWSAVSYSIDFFIDYPGGSFNTGFQPMQSVPFAKFAKSSFEADKVVKIPEPYILGRSTASSSAKYNFNGKYGWQAAQKMCEATFPGDPNVRAFTLEQITQALVLGNYDATNLANIDQVEFWAITPLAYGSNSTFNRPHQNNAWGLNLNSGEFGRGTSGKIFIDDDLTNGNPTFNDSKTYLQVIHDKAPEINFPCMCGTYKN
ncbi:MAG: hypothetical protein ACSHW7_01430 [Patiriisocius sp.]|uniref:hypothetical protein n=1 Tax=Patiriisocius sp. TaxID=2822396 RepID=UPI003EF8D20D